MGDLVIRPLRGTAEYLACVELQRRTWGEQFGEVVPPSMLMVAQEMGGVASGAFDGDRLAGFVFGISGLRAGAPAHWSDMLAVDPAYRGHGLGRRLKLHQRDVLLAQGIRVMVWTFDPLVARNAHLNLTRLGAIARTYKRDAYGASNSPLHAGIGTDRLVAEWLLDHGRTIARLQDAAPPDDDPAPPLVADPEPGDPFPRPGLFQPLADASHVGVAIPADIDALKAADAELARAWRMAVREALEWAFGAGFVATAFRRGPDGMGAYTLSRGF